MQCNESSATRAPGPRSLVARSLAFAGILGAVMYPAGVFAQGSGTSASETATTENQATQQLAPVHVTANADHSGYAPSTVETGPYRGLDALDVPATVNVVTRDVMDEQGDTGLYDALRNVAGVTRQQLNGVAYDQLAIRGIALDNRLPERRSADRQQHLDADGGQGARRSAQRGLCVVLRIRRAGGDRQYGHQTGRQ